MRVEIIYRGGRKREVIDCKDCYAHEAGGWMCYKSVGTRQGDIFISSADVRSIMFPDRV